VPDRRGSIKRSSLCSGAIVHCFEKLTAQKKRSPWSRALGAELTAAPVPKPATNALFMLRKEAASKHEGLWGRYAGTRLISRRHCSLGCSPLGWTSDGSLFSHAIDQAAHGVLVESLVMARLQQFFGSSLPASQRP
jgi:hypothetical protein